MIRKVIDYFSILLIHETMYVNLIYSYVLIIQQMIAYVTIIPCG